MADIFTFAQVGLAVALVASLAAFVQDRNRVPVSDPWFMPVIGVLLWQSLK
jgi:hypothetical protein